MMLKSFDELTTMPDTEVSTLNNIDRYKEKYGMNDIAFNADKLRLFAIFDVDTLEELNVAITALI